MPRSDREQKKPSRKQAKADMADLDKEFQQIAAAGKSGIRCSHCQAWSPKRKYCVSCGRRLRGHTIDQAAVGWQKEWDIIEDKWELRHAAQKAKE